MSRTTASTLHGMLTHKEGRTAKSVVYFAAFVVLGMAAAVIGPTLPALAERTHVGLGQISLLFTTRALGYMLGSLRGGRLYDRSPGHPVMAAAVLLMGLTLFAMPLIPVLWVLTAVVLLLGVAEGALDVGGNTLLVWTHGRKVGPFMNALHLFWGLGAFLSPLLVAQAVLVSGDITLAYWGLAVLMLPPAIALLRLPSPAPARAAADGNSGDASWLALLLAVFLFLVVAPEAAFGGWVYSYAVTLHLADRTTAAYLTSVFWGSFTLGRLVGIPIAARAEPRTILFADLVGCLLSLGLILLWPESQAAIWVGTWGMGLFIASLFPTAICLGERCLTITGRLTGWFFAGAALAGMSVPWVIGQLFVRVGPRSMMVICVADGMAAMGVLAVLVLLARRLGAKQTLPQSP